MPECENRIMENDSRVEKGRIEEGSQTGLYEMEELLPLLAVLTRMFTSGESGSVSYERARHLMEGILYTLRIYEKEGSLVGGRKPDASEAWRIGQELLARMVQETQEKYRLVCEHFQAYGNRNLQDTFVMALPGFFRLYDRKFAPQETIITMDYPVLSYASGLTGILAIDQYLDAIAAEQNFLQRFPEEYVKGILMRFQKDYQSQFFNLGRIVLRHLLGCMLIEKRLGETSVEEDYIALRELVEQNTEEELRQQLLFLIRSLDRKSEKAEERLEEKAEPDTWKHTWTYLSCDVGDFVTELKMGAANGCLERIVVL